MPAIFKASWSAGQEQQQAIKETNDHLVILENELKNKKFFGGDSIGLADIVACFISLWFGIFQELSNTELMSRDKFPNISQWIDEYLKCDIIKAALPRRDELLVELRRRFVSNK